MTAPGVEVIRDELDAWNAANKRARDEYRNHPLEKDVATVCLSAGCDNDRAWGRNRCAFHYGAKESADQQDYRARRAAR